MAGAVQHTENWQTLPWKEIQRNVFRLQKRIYQAAHRGEWKRVHSLQRLLLRSWSACCLAVRRVTQDNRGKRTPGVDGVASLTPEERMELAKKLRNQPKITADPVRRIYIHKKGKKKGQRGLGIPTMRDRAKQALVKLALEPEWEASFEPNSYGFRPGRSVHDAIEAVFKAIVRKPKYVLETDIEKCFDQISHKALLAKLNTIRPVERQVKVWLEAGIMDKGKWIFPEAGTPQGGVLSPLLANVALHGLEEELTRKAPWRHKVMVIRYADDVVILSPDLGVLIELRECAEEWLNKIGLKLNADKTQITHTLEHYEGRVGFDFLGFNVRQYKAGKHRTKTYRGQPGMKTLIKPSKEAIERHLSKLGATIQRYRGVKQAALIAVLNPVIRGWSRHYRTSVAKRIFSRIDSLLNYKLVKWARWRHPEKTIGWCYKRYWQRKHGRKRYRDGQITLIRHDDMRISRHVKVKGDKSPYDGDWVYWGQRLGRDPSKPQRVIRLLKRDNGRCIWCGLRFRTEDVIEVHHWDGDRENNRYANLTLLHGHCHDQLHTERC